jgi:hypothetical protein
MFGKLFVSEPTFGMVDLSQHRRTSSTMPPSGNKHAFFTTNLTDLNNLYGAYSDACHNAPTSARTEKAWETYLEYSILYHRERGIIIQHPPIKPKSFYGG